MDLIEPLRPGEERFVERRALAAARAVAPRAMDAAVGDETEAVRLEAGLVTRGPAAVVAIIVVSDV